MEILNEWYDTTTYRRGDNERVPSCWTFNTGIVRITLIKNHRYYPDKWALSCHTIGLDAVVLKADINTPLETMQAAAIGIVRATLIKMKASLPTP